MTGTGAGRPALPGEPHRGAEFFRVGTGCSSPGGPKAAAEKPDVTGTSLAIRAACLLARPLQARTPGLLSAD